MSIALRVLFGLALLLSPRASPMRRTSVSPIPASQADAKRYETYLRANWQPGRKSARELRAEADKALAASTDPRAASRAYAQAVVADANDADAWLGLARSLLAIKAEQGSERYDLPVNASGAALIAYERGAEPRRSRPPRCGCCTRH